MPASSREGDGRGRRHRRRAASCAIPALGPLADARRGAASERRAGAGPLRRRRAISSPASPSAGTSATTGSATSSASPPANGPTGARSPRSRSRGCSSARSRRAASNPLKDALGAVDDVVAMTDRVIEIRLVAPRPNLLALLAQPEFAIVRDGAGHRPVPARSPSARAPGALRLHRGTSRPPTTRPARREEVAADGAAGRAGGRAPSSPGESDLVLGGTLRRSAVRAAAPSCRAERCASIPPRACSAWSRSRAGGAARQARGAPPAQPGDRPRRASSPRSASPGSRRARPCSKPGLDGMPRQSRRRGSATADRRAPRRRSPPKPTGCSAKRQADDPRRASRRARARDLLLRRSCSATGARSGFAVERAATPARRPTSR